jgi:hypothetical protein
MFCRPAEKKKMEKDFDKKMKRPMKRNYRQPSCPESMMILPLRHSLLGFLSFFKGTVSQIGENSKHPPAPALCLTLCVSLADRGVLEEVT